MGQHHDSLVPEQLSRHFGFVLEHIQPGTAQLTIFQSRNQCFFIHYGATGYATVFGAQTGRGKVFCAGNDLGEFRTMDGGNGDVAMCDARRAFFAVLECRLPPSHHR